MIEACVAFLAMMGIPGGQDVYSFGVNVRTVYVDVSVVGNDEFAFGLTVADFEVLDEGVRQKVDLLDRDKIPLTAFLILDTSASVAGERIEHLREAARALLDELESRDRAALVTFSHEIQLIGKVGEGVSIFHERLSLASAEGGTSLNDALFSSLVLAKEAPGRPLILLFSDGQDTTSWLTETKLVEVAKRSDALIHAVVVTPSLVGPGSLRLRREMAEHLRQTAFLREVTGITGGRVWETAGGSDLKEAFARIVREMKSRYLLSFSPPGTPREGWHRLTVRVRRRGVDVRARPGYYSSTR